MRFNQEFEHVGPRVLPGDVLIDSEMAESFRQTAMLGAKVTTLELEEATEVTTKSYASGMLSSADRDYEWVREVANVGVFAKTVLQSEPDAWRSRVSVARFRFVDDVDTKIYNHYEVEAVEGFVTRAVRQVQVIRGRPDIIIDEDESLKKVVEMDRKSFEHSLRPLDIANVQSVIGRISARQAAMRR